jgi:peptidoglycan/xylan/chitin deacetylase (PgdA/CDA1 family)
MHHKSIPSIAMILVVMAMSLFATTSFAGTPILVYHRFGPTVADSMTVRTKVFQEQLDIMREKGYTVIPLRTLVEHRLTGAPAPPDKSVVITVDDGHRTVYTELFPLIKKYKLPVTLFIYPSAISNASYAMTWEQIKEILASGLVEVQSHTYWHPNFIKEKKKLPPAEYQKLLVSQLRNSRLTLEKRLGNKVEWLAWPFGLYNKELMANAAENGYSIALSIERRHASDADDVHALPRYLMEDRDQGATFVRLLAGDLQDGKKGY